MRNAVFGFIAFFTVPGAMIAGEAVGDSLKRQVTVHVYNYAKVDQKKLELAQRIAGQIYGNAGIEIEWLSGPTTIEEIKKFSTPRLAANSPRLFLRIKPSPPARCDKNEGVCGEALFSEGKALGRIADIYFDRVENLTWKKLRPATESTFGSQWSPNLCIGLTLGVVMAHEMGHLLLGTNSHSRYGIMRPNWDRQEMLDAYVGKQTFMPEQVPQLHANLRAREEIASAEARF